MKYIPYIVAGAVLMAAGYVAAYSQAQPALASFSDPYLSNTMRSCLFPPDGWTIVDCSDSVAATSEALDPWSRYVVQCNDVSYISWGDDATDVADANDGWLPAGAWLEFLTTPRTRYVSCLNVNTDSDCRYIACQ